VEDMQIQNHRYTFIVFDGNATASPQMIPAQNVSFQQFIETWSTLSFLTRIDAAFGYASVPRRIQGHDLLNGYWLSLLYFRCQ
jgi:hypothetical protein